jgi:hypothetical protein
MGEDTRLEELQECYEIVLKTARRVTRDLRHAIDNIPPENQYRQMMFDRYLHFQVILDDIRDYRIQIHNEMDRLRYRAEEAERIAEELSREKR